ncbi:hypothetical protein Hanom_Chr08g00755591 [Helianthus anomalus]
MTAENLAALLLSLQGGDGNPPSVSTAGIQDAAATSQVETEIVAITDEAEKAARKKHKTDFAPNDDLSGPSTDPEPTPSNDHQPDQQTEDASKKKSTEEPYLYDFNFDFEPTPSQPGSLSGVRFEVGSSIGAGDTEHDEAAFRYATEKRQVFESDSDSDEDAYVKRLKRRVVVLEQDAELKNAQISSLQQDRAAAHAAAEAERAAALEAYLAAKPKKRSSKPKKKKEKQSGKQLLVIKNQDLNPLGENFQLKDPTKRPDRLVMELGSSHYDDVGNKSEFACWRYEHDKEMWLTKIDLKTLLCAPYYDPELNQRGRGWAFHSRLEKEVKTNFATMKTAEPTIKRNPGVRDPYTKRTIRFVISPATDKEKIIPLAKKFERGILKNFKFWAYDPKMPEAVIVTEEQSIRIANSYDLMSFHEEDVLILTNHHIRTNKKYEECAKAWTRVVANILMHDLFAPDQEQGGPQV